MRYQEFELTEDELFELKMSPTNLSKMAKNIDARVGMEFELIVPNAEVEDEEGYESEPDYDADESFPTGPGWQRDVIDFFRGGSMGNSTRSIQRAIDELNENFYAWVDEDQEDWINSNLGQARVREIAYDNIDKDAYDTEEELIKAVQDYIDENEDSIREQIIDEYNDDLDSKFAEWLEENGIGFMSDFANEHSLDWPYWTEPEYYGSGGVSIDTVADEFSQAIGRPVNASSSYHGATRQPGRYVVEPDSSLHGDEPGDGGLEFVSPPLTVDEMLSDIDKVAAWAGRVGAYTNSSTGLHMNVSVPGQQNLDFVKLAMFLGDNYILEQFGREGNTYCKSILKQIMTTARSEPGRVEEMMRQFQGGLNQLASKVLHTGSTGKYSSINNRGEWVEFRGPGGDWLGDDLSAVKNTMLRAVVATDVATKPEEFKQEYYKKLYKTLSQGQDNDVIQYFAKFAAGELPQSALKAFVRQIQGKRSAKKMAQGAKDILLVWRVIGSQSSPYQSQGTEVVAQDELGAYKEAIKKWNLNIGSQSVEGWVEYNGWRAQPVRAATTADLNQASNKFYRVYAEGGSQGVWVRAMSEFQAKNLAVGRHPGMFTSAVTFDDIVASHDPNYDGPETAFNIRGSSGDPVPAGAVGGEQSSDANYEIINLDNQIPVFRFIANTDQEAQRKFQDWMAGTGASGRFHVRRIEGRGIPGSTAELQRQRAEQPQVQDFRVSYTVTYDDEVRNNAVTVQARNADAAVDAMRTNLQRAGYTVDRIEAEPAPAAQSRSQDQEFTGIWEVVSRTTDEVVHNFSGIGNAVADAMIYANRWAQTTGFDDPIYVRPLMRARDNIPRQQGEVQARGTESLPPGNVRWLVLDRNDNEVYSFVNTTAQSDANQYARDWMINRAPREVRDNGPFTIVPAR